MKFEQEHEKPLNSQCLMMKDVNLRAARVSSARGSAESFQSGYWGNRIRISVQWTIFDSVSVITCGVADGTGIRSQNGADGSPLLIFQYVPFVINFLFSIVFTKYTFVNLLLRSFPGTCRSSSRSTSSGQIKHATGYFETRVGWNKFRAIF